MPAQIPRPEIMDEDQLMKEVLDKFINCPEQTYEEFLSTFTHLPKENNVARRGAHGPDLSENIFTTKKLTHKKESHGHHFRNTAVIPHTSSECSEDDQVDNFLDLEDLDMEEESEPQMNTDRLLLPGEVEEDVSASVPAYVPSVNLPLTSEVKPKPTVRRTLKQMEEIFGDEVQPFFLDEEFDYDNVTLTPKFTAGEIATIQELAKQKTMDTNTDFCEQHD
ncbi:Intraflagellar transport-associated protein [Lemmus lemmus]